MSNPSTPDKFCRRGLFYGAGLAVLHQGTAARAGGPPRGGKRLRLDRLRLAAAARETARALGAPIRVDLPREHAALQREATLEMAVEDPADALTAVCGAFGVRWLRTEMPAGFLIVDKARYRSEPAGLRQAMADGLPAEVAPIALLPTSRGVAATEAILKGIGPADLAALEAATQEGLVPLDRLDPRLAHPLKAYLQGYAAHRLGVAADRFHVEFREAAAAPVRYGANESGAKQFLFRFGRGWLGVAPE